GVGEPLVGLGAGDDDPGDGVRVGRSNVGVGSGGGGGGSVASGWHANSTPISSDSTSSTPARPSTTATRLRSGGRSPGASPGRPGTTPGAASGRSSAGSPDPCQYGWNCGPRRRPPHQPRPAPRDATGSRKRPAPGRSGSYALATHGAGPAGCAATTRHRPPRPEPDPASPGPPEGAPGGTPARPDGTAALIAARNRSRAAASSAAPRVSTATLARRPSESTPRYTIPAADS